MIATVSQTTGLDVGIEHEISAGIGIELDKVKASVESSLKESFNFKSELTNTWARTVTDSVSTTSGYLTQFSQEYTEAIHFSEAAGFKKGYYYRMAFYDSLKAYGVLVYDIANDRYSATTDYLFGDKTPVRVWETSDSPVFAYEPHKDLVFDVEQAIAYAKAHSKPEPTVAPASGTYYLPTTPLSCGLDNGYNYDKPSRDANNKHFSHDFDFGNFVLTGCTKDITEKDSYFTLPNNSVDISFRLEYDTDHLPLQDTMTSRSVSNDNKQSGFYKLPWNVGERNVGRGMIVVLVEYDDGTPSQKICTVNALGGKGPGELVSIVTVDKPCTVTIAICYELVQWAPGFLGISDDYWTNWRINQTFRFR